METVDINRYFNSKKARFCQGQKKQHNITKNKTKETIPFSMSSPTAKVDIYQNHVKKEKRFIFLISHDLNIYVIHFQRKNI